jgi:hypothetical protein
VGPRKRTRVRSNRLRPILLAGVFLAGSTSLVFSQPAPAPTCRGCPNVTPFACYPPTHITWTRDRCGCLVQRCSPDAAPTAGNPTISDLSPASGSVGAQITIHGSGFGATNNMVIFQASDGGIRYIGGRPERGGQPGIPSPDGTSLTFTVPSTVQNPCPGPAHCAPRDEAVVAGAYTVQVVRLDADSNAPSNIMPITVQ